MTETNEPETTTATSATDDVAAWYASLPATLKPHYNPDGTLTELGRQMNPAFAEPVVTKEEIAAVEPLFDRGYARATIATMTGLSRLHVRRVTREITARRAAAKADEAAP